MATSREEANIQLRQLRADRGDGEVPASSTLIAGYSRALNLISEQIYKKPTRFLLELIQNADDNEYGNGVRPSLDFKLYRKGSKFLLRADCNEIGFTYSQISALLSIGESTKPSMSDGQRGYIGEKGIGFKSVFKIADVVEIASGHYQFKLDNRQMLGMIMPILSEFPSSDRIPGRTQFLFHLKGLTSYNQVLQDLKTLKLQTLLFLRKLQNLNVDIEGHINRYSRTVTGDDINFGGETALVFRTNEASKTLESHQYIIQRHEVLNMPQESLRGGIVSSEVLLAFPISENAEPISQRQDAFAFLSIEDSGLNFITHGDFLLIASREGLQEQNDWNDRLFRGLSEAFVSAVDRFLSLNPDASGRRLRYSWPSFLSQPKHVNPTWRKVVDHIVSDLRNRRIVESRVGPASLKKAAELFYVPERFRFGNGTLFDLTQIKKKHLSFGYQEHSRTLEVFGLNTLGICEFLEEFRTWLRRTGNDGFRNMPTAWHQKVAEIFMEDKSRSVRRSLRGLRIIPLSDGRNGAAATSNIYLPPENENEHIPNGIDIQLVDLRAAGDPKRREFFEYLGIPKYDPHDVCGLILNLHRRSCTDRSTEDLISDTAYLFRHRSHLGRNVATNLTFMAMRRNKTVKGSTRLYIDEGGLIGKYKDAVNTPFEVLHPEYERAIVAGDKSKRKKFHKWLLRCPKFFTLPVLVSPASGYLSPEWTFLAGRDVSDLLVAIRDQWDELETGKSLIKETARSLEIRCLDGKPRPLQHVALPTTTVLKNCPNLDFMELPSPQSAEWKFLSCFGVLTQWNERAMLKQLSALRRLSPNTIQKSTVHKIYRDLSLASEDDTQCEIRDHFREPLVFIAAPTPEWVDHRSCVWKAHSSLKQVVKLNSHYPDLKNLFKDILEVKNAGLEHFVDELCSLSTEPCDNMSSRYEALFQQVAILYPTHNASATKKKQILRLKSAKVFPVAYDGSGPSNVRLRSLRSDWYIPDRTTLQDTFKSSKAIGMLNFSVALIQTLKPLFQTLDCEKKYLSTAVTETLQHHGTAVRDLSRENDLKTRLRYISELSTDSEGRRRSLNEIRVFLVPSITINRFLADFEIVESKGLVKICETPSTTEFYIHDRLSREDDPEVRSKLAEHFILLFSIAKEDRLLCNRLLEGPTSKLREKMEESNRFLPPESNENENQERPAETREQERIPSNTIDLTIEDEGNHNANIEDPRPSSPHEPMILDKNKSSLGDGPSLGELRPSHHAKRRNATPGSSRSTLGGQNESSGRLPSTPNRPTTRSQSRRISETMRLLSEPSTSSPPRQVSPQLATQSDPISSAMSRAVSPTPLESSEMEDDAPTNMPPQVASSGRRPGLRPTMPRAEASGPMNRARNANLPPGDNSAAATRSREIGVRGERFAYSFFSDRISDWNHENWTSRFRVEADFPPFTALERDYADFTYLDRNQRMTRVLEQEGATLNPSAVSNRTKFHLEVKSTPEDYDEPFYLSQNQHDKMRAYHDDPRSVYVIIRVYGLDSGDGPRIKFYVDPWKLYMDETIFLKSTGVYEVRVME